MCSARDVTSSPPRELNLVTIDVSTLCLGIDAINNVAVGKFPIANTLRLIESEVALEGGAVRVEPLALHELAILEVTNILLHCLLKDVGALTILLSAGPVTRVHIFINVGHHTLSVALTVFPVAVVLADSSVLLLANTVFAVVKPHAGVGDDFILGGLVGVSVVTFTLAFLCAQKEQLQICFNSHCLNTYAFFKVTCVRITVGVVRSSLASVVA